MEHLSAVFLLTVFQVICTQQQCQGAKMEVMLQTDKEEVCIINGIQHVQQFIRQTYGKSTHTYTFTCTKIPVPGAPPSPAIPDEKKDDTI